MFYNPAYRKIAYPMGDVPRYFGVCTDVVVRAYRALGIDLQVLVHKSGAGSGDTNIDHRRVEVLRRFFARAGTSLPVTDNPADYQPGDIVTYYFDEELLFPEPIGQAPTVLWFGNPVNAGGPVDWTSLNILEVDLRSAP